MTLDEDLVEALELAEGTLSSQITEAVRCEVERRARQTLLTEWLAGLESPDGPVGAVSAVSVEEPLV